MKLYITLLCLVVLCLLQFGAANVIRRNDDYWSDKDWVIKFNYSGVVDNKGFLLINNGKRAYFKSIDAGYFNKDINEELHNCKYVYDNRNKEHYMQCKLYIEKYNKDNTDETYTLKFDFGTDQVPDCSIISSSTEFTLELYNDKDEKIQIIGEQVWNRIRRGGTLPFQNDHKYQTFRFQNDECDFKLNFKEIKVTYSISDYD